MGRLAIGLATLAAGSVFAAAVGAVPAAAAPPAGGQLKASSQAPSLSADGSRVAFVSKSPDVVPGDTNAASDVFVKDLRTGAVTRVSVARNGAGGNNDSIDPSISADGTKVAFVSIASNLVDGDTNGARDVFVKDLRTGAVVRASTTASGGQIDLGGKDPSLSGDGTKLAFVSFSPDLSPGDTNAQTDVFVKDLTSGAVVRASTGDQAGGPSLSADGDHVAFWQYPKPVNGIKTPRDVYVLNLRTNTVVIGSTKADGTRPDDESSEPSLSADGSRVSFTSFASNLVPGDINGAGDVFLKDLGTGAVTLVSRKPNGPSADFTSEYSVLSGDGNLVAFMSFAANLIAGDTNNAEDIFVRNLRAGTLVRASTGSRGAQVAGASYEPCLSANGARLGFSSSAATFVAGDTNGVQDVFAKTLKSGAVVRVSAKKPAPVKKATAKPTAKKKKAKKRS